MSKNPVLTIIVPSFNISKYIDECLPSYIDERLVGKIKVYLIDDGATDDTASKAEFFVKKYPEIFSFFHKSNGGHGSVINFGVYRLVQTKFFKVVDGDDYVDADNLLKLCEYLENCNSDMVISDFISKNSKINEYFIGADSEINPYINYDSNTISSFNYSIHRITYMTDFYKNSGLLLTEKVFYEDTEYSLFLLDKIRKISYVNLPVYIYRQGEASQSTSPMSLLKHFNDFEIIFNEVLDKIINAKGNVKQTLVKSTSGSLRLWYLLILFNKREKNKRKKFLMLDEKIKSDLQLSLELSNYKVVRLLRFMNFRFLFLFRILFKKRF